MDPKACLQRILDNMANENDSETIQATSDLLIWILKGGEVPTVNSVQIVDLELGYTEIADFLV